MEYNKEEIINSLLRIIVACHLFAAGSWSEQGTIWKGIIVFLIGYGILIYKDYRLIEKNKIKKE